MMIHCTFRFPAVWALLAAVVVCAPLVSQGAIVVTQQTTSGNTFPTTPSVATDLLQTDLASVNPVGGDNLLTGPAKYNGTTGSAAENSGTNPATVNAAGTYDFFLDTTTNTLGYDVTSIVTYTGWGDFRAGQDQRVSYSLVGDSTFVQVADIAIAHSNGTLRTEISEDTLPEIASGVDAIRYIVDQSTFVYREVDVHGVPTIPEPSTLALAALGLLGLLGCRRRRS